MSTNKDCCCWCCWLIYFLTGNAILYACDVLFYILLACQQNKVNTKTYPSRLNWDVSKDGDCPAGTLLINTSTLLAEVTK